MQNILTKMQPKINIWHLTSILLTKKQLMYKSTLLVALILIVSACGGKEVIDPVLEAEFTFSGKWLGTWSDDLFQSVPVSATVREIGPNNYIGDFFYTNNGNEPYTPAFGGSTDGRMTFETKGDSLLNFVYNQVAPEYRGGCPGIYEGAGAINRNLNRLVISFTGNDCDGFHDNGKIIFQLDE